ncbi:MAG: carotenoid biosynthesis protein [Spirulinaceae cyanobacterium SM2_1_0]|nr:carotenoid biosynthesis protein [Spirulinaceae cyanobacterium SM2_1_0]
MKHFATVERSLLVGHAISMVFGLAGLLIVLPHAELIVQLSEFGQYIFQWSMAGGGVVYMVLGTAAVAVYACRQVGWRLWLSFMLPAVLLSLGSELLGTSTGFPFGHYRYLAGLGYKIAGLVPFTIPLSWFYLGFSAYILARVGLERFGWPRWLQLSLAIALGSVLLTSWDFVLDPAMSQTLMPFWIWEQPGAFFGMPYQNFVGWLGTGIVFMTVATLLWPRRALNLSREQLRFPLAIYLSNLTFATVMSLAAGFWVPVALGIAVGVVPAIALYAIACPQAALLEDHLQEAVRTPLPTDTVPVSVASAK